MIWSSIAGALLALLYGVFLYVYPGAIRATAGATLLPQIVQVHPAPVAGTEWIEIYNPNTASIDLSGWQLEDILTTPSVLLSLSQTLSPTSILHLELPTAKLNNSGDGVVLRDNAGQVVDTMQFGTTETGLSWLRSSLDPSSAWLASTPTPGYIPPQLSPSPSPAAPTPVPSPTPQPSILPTPSTLEPAQQSVILTIAAYMPCPASGQQEWVELINQSSNPAYLEGWMVRDASGNTEKLSGQILSGARKTVSWSGSLLNNTGDTLSLINPSGIVVDSASYATGCQAGTSMSVSSTSSNDLLVETVDDAEALAAQATNSNTTNQTENSATQPNSNAPSSVGGSTKKIVWPNPDLSKIILSAQKSLPPQTPPISQPPDAVVALPPASSQLQLLREPIVSAIIGGLSMCASACMVLYPVIKWFEQEHAHQNHRYSLS